MAQYYYFQAAAVLTALVETFWLRRCRWRIIYVTELKLLDRRKKLF